MSLFKIREFWTTTSEDDEYFDNNSIVVTKLNGEYDLIITGSQSGVLRIFQPAFKQATSDLGGYDPSDLVIEKIFDNPILQIGFGRFVTGSQTTHLAILHPRSLSVYSLICKESSYNQNTQNTLEFIYEHKLPRAAYNFAVGSFGNATNRDFICVQSLDGALMFFEQENASFTWVLPDFLLPGPIQYMARTDSFIFGSSDWCLVCYRYKTLSDNIDEKSTPDTRIRNYDWSNNLGEPPMDISIIDDIANKQTFIMVLGEHNLFCLNANGQLIFMKRMEYCSSCFHTYLLDENIFSVVISSDTNTLLIYENTRLKWSAKLNFTPVFVKRAFIKNIPGAIVLLSEEGRLECCYLGTEPSLFIAPPVSLKDIDFDQANQELIALNKILKHSNQNHDVQNNLDTDLQVSVNVSRELQTCTVENNLKSATNMQMVEISIVLNPQTTFEEVQVAIFVNKPLKAVPKSMFYSNLSNQSAFVSNVFVDKGYQVISLKCKIVITCVLSLGFPKTVVKDVKLPMNLVLENCPAEKEGTYKITLNTSHKGLQLKELFPEYDLDQVTNTVGFKSIIGIGEPVTILLAKSLEKYRLQSNSLTSLSLLVEQVVYRIKNHHSFNSGNEKYQITSTMLSGSEELLSHVIRHYKDRQVVCELQNDLSQMTAQFRLIQKRLIAKFKEKNPKALSGLELLLHDTHREIINLTDKLQQAFENLAGSRSNLSCVMYLIRIIAELVPDVNSDLRDMLEAVFSEGIYEMETQSWEDVTDAALCFLLRTILAKSEKDKLRAMHTSFEEIKDVSKLTKHLSQVLERISKIKSFKESNDTDEEILKEIPENIDENIQSEANQKLIGNSIAESSTRLLSARKSLLWRRNKINE